MPYPPTSTNLATHRILLREGFLSLGPYNSSSPWDTSSVKYVGATNGGITINLNPEITSLDVDQLHTSADDLVTAINGTIECNLAEANIYQMALTAGLPQSAVDGSSLNFNFANFFRLGQFNMARIETVAPPVDVGNAVNTRQFIFPKVKVIPASTLVTLSRTDPQYRSLTLNIKSHYDDSTGQEWFLRMEDSAVPTASDYAFDG